MHDKLKSILETIIQENHKIIIKIQEETFGDITTFYFYYKDDFLFLIEIKNNNFSFLDRNATDYLENGSINKLEDFTKLIELIKIKLDNLETRNILR